MTLSDYLLHSGRTASGLYVETHVTNKWYSEISVVETRQHCFCAVVEILWFKLVLSYGKVSRLYAGGDGFVIKYSVLALVLTILPCVHARLHCAELHDSCNLHR